VGRNTVEEIILRRAEHKLQLTHNVMSTTTDNAADDDDEDEDDDRLKVVDLLYMLVMLCMIRNARDVLYCDQSNMLVVDFLPIPKTLNQN